MISEKRCNPKTNVTVEYMKGYVPPTKTGKIHCHEYCEMMLIISGSITYADNDVVIKMPEKSLVFTKSHDVHNPSTAPDCLYERYKISFSPALRGEMLGENVLPLISASYKKRLNDADFAELLIYFKGLYEAIEYQKDDPLCEKLYLLSALQKGKRAVSLAASHEESYICGVIAYIKQNYRARLTCEELAARFFVSRGKLMYDFKSYTGMSVQEYLTVTRIEAGKQLLLKGYSVTAAADASGFSSPSYFIKVFSNITGMTPLKFQIKFSQKR